MIYLPPQLLGSICISALLLACTNYPEKNVDSAKNNIATFQRDAIDCAQAYPEAGTGAHVKQRIACMNLKGWH